MVRWTARAEADLYAISDFISADNPFVARGWIARLRQRANTVAEMPYAGRVVEEIGRMDVREVLVRNYRIVYRVAGDGIVVLTCFEGHRLLGDLDPDMN